KSYNERNPAGVHSARREVCGGHATGAVSPWTGVARHPRWTRIMKITLSDELPEDAAAIELLLQQAFQEAPHSNQSEHLIVRQLRASGDLSFALVARLADAVVGYAAVSPVTVAD